MKVLWLCNQMLPIIARQLGLSESNKEGWLNGIVSEFQKNETTYELKILFPYMQKIEGTVGNIQYESFLEDVRTPEKEDDRTYSDLIQILTDDVPDIIHCFGTEYAHTMLLCKAAKEVGCLQNVLVGIQGVMSACAERYTADLSQKIVNRRTLRDFLRKDSIKEQQDKFRKRAEFEAVTLSLAPNVTGRTDFDREVCLKANPSVRYYKMNETLRDCFYSEENSNPQEYSVFLSQGDYPLKGAHFALEALSIVREKYPFAKLYIAGNNITAHKTWKEKLKTGSYGKYLNELIQHYHLENNVVFIGRCNAQQMKERYLQSEVFICTSSVENSPNSIGEAMILSVPVVTSDVGGIRSIIEPDNEALFYPWNKPDLLAEALCNVFEDREGTNARVKNAKKHAIKTHCRKDNFARLIEIYHSILEG